MIEGVCLVAVVLLCACADALPTFALFGMLILAAGIVLVCHLTTEG